jgi:YegS/Rv2252/BmrU family lipid kinase
MRILVIHNPSAGWRRRRYFASVLAELRAQGHTVAVVTTMQPGDARVFARDISAERVDRLVIAGGDGTVNEAINGLNDRRVPIAVVPLGTANVLANELGLPRRAADLAAVITGGPTRTVALGRVNGHRFSLMAGIGFDAQVVANVNSLLKQLVGPLAYVFAGLWQLMRGRRGSYVVTIDGRRYHAAAVIIAKSRYYAGPFLLAPEARIDDPRLRVCLLKRGGRLAVLRYAAALLVGCLHRLSDVQIVAAERAEISGAAGEPVQADGDVVAQLPAVIEVARDDLVLVYPR